ncbi:MAG: aminopeptidase [Desulfovibrionaceae bacterium]|nr:aminopeptidase [Desulfovibrionaceae bacterium]
MKKEELTFTPKNCWDVYAAAKDRKAMDVLAARYMEFLSVCKTEREVVDYVVEKARAAGFEESAAADRQLRVFRGKNVLLARRGKEPLSKGSRLIGAHADSPRLDFKQHPLYEECGVGLAKTHYYGGIRKHQWLAAPLALHGVVVKKSGEAVRVVIGEDPADPVFTVPDLLPHLAQKQMERKLSEAFEAEKLNVVLAHEPPAAAKGKAGDADRDADKEKDKGADASPLKRRILEMLNERYGIVEEDLYSAELQAVPAGPARWVGLDRALMGGYGHDDRICVFCALEAMLVGAAPRHAQLALFWDKEEIGSEGATGAKSRFFEYGVQDLAAAWDPEARLSEIFLEMRAVSADVSAAMDPDYQDLHDKLNASLIGCGPCFNKFTGHRGKYAANDADAEYVAWMRAVLDKAGAPWQMAELGKVDLGGGGTVAKHLAEYGMRIIDFGPAVLSMHSPFELASKADLYATVKAYAAFLAA